jgi:RNA polymerase sigma-70 factor (ECF subfamily)
METDPAEALETEIALLKRIGEGDRRSFEDLYDRYSGVLFSTAYRVLNNQEAAEDVLQDVFVQIWEKAPLYDPKRGKPITWAVTLTRYKAIDRLRSSQRRGRLEEEVKRESETMEKFDGRSSFDAVASAEAGEMVRAALQALSADQREAIELAFFSSLTQLEIAERLKEPLGTIKARIRRGMMRLREVIGPRL